MSISLSGRLFEPMKLEEVPDGCLFLLAQGERGQLLCMLSRSESWLVIVLGGVGAENNKPGWFPADSVLGNDVLVFEAPLALELLPEDDAPFGLPMPAQDRSNGCILVDGSAIWFSASGGPGRWVTFNLHTGLIEAAPRRAQVYSRWCLTRTKPGAKEPVEIYRHG